MLVNVLDHRPGDRDPVVGTRPASDLVEQHQAALRNIIQDAGRLEHLDHERRFALRNVVRSAHPREDLVHDPDTGLFRRHVASHLRHQYDQRRLPQQRRLTGHVGAGNDDDLLRRVVEQHVVRNVLLAHFHQRLDHRVTPFADVENRRIVDIGPAIVPFDGQRRERQQTVDPRDRRSVYLDLRGILRQFGQQRRKQLLLKHQDTALGSENLLLVLLEFRRDIAFGSGQRLLAYPRLRHLVLVGIAHFDVVTEHVVEADLQRRDAGRFALALLDTGENLFTVRRDVTQVVQLDVDARSDDAPLLDLVRRIGIDLPLDPVAHLQAQVELVGQLPQRLRPGAFQRIFDLFDGKKGIFELHHLARSHPPYGDPRDDPFQISDHADGSGKRFAQRGVADKQRHDVQPAVDLPQILQRQRYPATQHPRAHRRRSPVEHIEQRTALLAAVGRKQFEIPNRKLVDPHEAVLVDPRDGRYVFGIAVLGKFEVIKNGSCRHDGFRHPVDAESLQRSGAELGLQLLPAGIFGEHPRVKPVGIVPRSESFRKFGFAPFLVNDLFRRQVGQQFVDILVVAFGRIKFAGRNIQKRHAGALLTKKNRCEKSIFLAVQHVVAIRHARRNQFDHATFDDLLRGFRVLELLANRYPFAGAHQFRQVGVDGMVRKPGQFDERSRAVGPARQRNAQYPAGPDRILAESFIKIAHPKQQDGVAVHRFHAVVLFHQRRLDVFGLFGFLFCQGSSIFYWIDRTVKLAIFRQKIARRN